MTRESLPIKCLEAVILGMYPLSYVSHVLTTGLVVPLMSWVHNIWPLSPWRKRQALLMILTCTIWS